MGPCIYRPDHTWPRLKDAVRFTIATFLQHTSKVLAYPLPSFAAHAACLALLSAMSRFWRGAFDVLSLLPPPRGRHGRCSSLCLFLKARQWHYTVYTFGMLDIPSMRTVVFPGSHLGLHEARSCQPSSKLSDSIRVQDEILWTKHVRAH